MVSSQYKSCVLISCNLLQHTRHFRVGRLSSGFSKMRYAKSCQYPPLRPMAHQKPRAKFRMRREPIQVSIYFFILPVTLITFCFKQNLKGQCHTKCLYFYMFRVQFNINSELDGCQIECMLKQVPANEINKKYQYLLFTIVGHNGS